MINVAVCEKTDSGDILAALGRAEQNNSVTFFDNTDELTASINTGGAFDIFILDRAALDELLEARQRDNNRILLLRTRDGDIAVPYSDIICVEFYNRMLAVHIEGSKPLYSKNLRVSFEESLLPLLEDGRFIHTRKSCVINMAKIKKFKRDSVVMTNGTEAFIPRYLYAKVREAYLGYLSV